MMAAGVRVGRLGEYAGLGLALLMLVLFFSWRTEHFLTWTTFRTIANQVPDALVLATAMTLVLIAGGIDLSVGSVLALCSAVLGVSLLRGGLGLGAAVLACLAAGLCAGLVNGWIIARWRLPAFIVTLGMLEAARGMTLLVTQSRTQYIGGAVEWLAGVSYAGVSLPFAVALAIALGTQCLLSLTAFGRHVFAVGANEETARLSGISVGGTRCAVYALCGGLTGCAAVLHTARLGSADPNIGIGYELQAIAAAVIGGTSLSGGRGAVLNTVFGVLIIAVLQSGLAQIGAQEYAKRMVTGGVIVLAVLFDYYRNRRSR
jgi:ribose transport system permease protein